VNEEIQEVIEGEEEGRREDLVVFLRKNSRNIFMFRLDMKQI